jgi:adenylate cyclase
MEAPPLERKLVAILAADVAGYSRLMGIDEEGTLDTLSSFRLIIDARISQYGGKICGTAGDSVLAAFGSALAAVQCAVEVQNELAHSNGALEEDRRMDFRIGINVGDVMVKDGDIFGDGVNIAARVEGLAEPGGICISRGIHDHIMNKLPFRFEDLGEKSVKNIAQPIRVFRLCLDGQEAGAPLGEAKPQMPGEASAPDVAADIPSLSEEPPVAQTSDPQSVEIEFWDSIRIAFAPTSTKPTWSNTRKVASSRLPEFALKRSGKKLPACEIRRIGKLSCLFGSLFATARIPPWSKPISRNIPTGSLTRLPRYAYTS